MYAKLFSSILDSSIWLEPTPTRILWITMLAMADEEGIVAASVGGLAKRAGVSREECEAGLATLMAPDPDSRNPEHEGRRVEKVQGGWLLLNHASYREIRTARQRRDADRQARHREKLKQTTTDDGVTSVTVTDVTTIASTSASTSGEEQEQPVPEKEPVGRDRPRLDLTERPAFDPIKGVLADAGLDLTRFGKLAGEVGGFLRGQRSPSAVAAILRSHLDGDLGPAVPPAVLGLAVREYAAQGEGRFNAAHFAGFVRRAEKAAAQKPGRMQARQEERFIATEDHEAERAKREEAATAATLADFERTNEAKYQQLLALAEAEVPRQIKGTFRAPMVRAVLARLVRASGGAS